MKGKRRKKKNVVSARPAALYALLAAAFAGLLLRLAVLCSAPPGEAAAAGRKNVVLGVSRGTIYDRNLSPLVNTEKTLLTVRFVPDGGGGAPEIRRAAGRAEETPLVKNAELIERYSKNQLCPHVVGYVDASGHGVCGIERSFDRILSSAAGELGLKYTVNAGGQMLPGRGLEVVSSGYGSPAGVALTVDGRAQRISHAALVRSPIVTGAVVIVDVSTFEVIALDSVPAWDPNDVGASLDDPLQPFLNRAFSAYPVGSVFKPVTAAAALQRGIDVDDEYLCEGGLAVGDRFFRCYRSVPHGEVDLTAAVCRSCNGYFIRLARRTGARDLLLTAENLGFGRETRFTGDLVGAAGNLPAEDALSSPAALANFAFGQGELLASPLQLACAYAVLAGGGTYTEPTLLKYLVNDEKEIYAVFRSEKTWRALSEATCERVNAALRVNMTEGTGKNGASAFVSSAGKTATAQTGLYGDDGKERLCTWFCGFVPFEKPKYAVVVFNENGSAASEDCAPVFKEIIEGLYDAEMLEEDLQPE